MVELLPETVIVIFKQCVQIISLRQFYIYYFHNYYSKKYVFDKIRNVFLE